MTILKPAFLFCGLVVLASALAAQTPVPPKPPTGRSDKAPSVGQSSQGMTKEQADEILDELRQIRQLLEKQQTLALLAPHQTPNLPLHVNMNLSTDEYSLGRADAPITMLEFADYQCPYCRRFQSQAYGQLKKNYIDTGKVRLVARDFPLDFHPSALSAAVAARCAGEQGKFWEMRDFLFGTDPELNKGTIIEGAQGLALDITKFKICVDAPKFNSDIAKETAEATTLGISGTPTFIVGKSANGKIEGRSLVGFIPYEQLDVILQNLLKSSAVP